MMLSVAGALDRPQAGNILDVEVQNEYSTTSLRKRQR